MRQMNLIKSNKHNIYSVACNKVTLSCNDDKRLILDNNIETLALRLLQTFAGAFLKKKITYARCVLGNHHNLHIDKKVIKCRIR